MRRRHADSLYPKAHNYARVVPNDAYQGAGLASFAKGEGVKSAYVLYAGGDPTSLGQAHTFQRCREEGRDQGRRLHLLEPEGLELHGADGKGRRRPNLVRSCSPG